MQQDGQGVAQGPQGMAGGGVEETVRVASCRCVLKVELRGFAHGLDMRYKRKER